MPAVQSMVRKTAKVRDLPPELTKGLRAEPDEVVTVTVETKASLRASDRALLKLMDQISDEAEANGLTQELLDEILADGPDAR